ncbi:hypothetical protein [Streptomyces sp. NPDC054784]
MPESSRTPAVYVRVSVVLRGRLFAAQQGVLPEQWADEEMRGHVVAAVRDQLERAASAELRDLSQPEREEIDTAPVEVHEDDGGPDPEEGS